MDPRRLRVLGFDLLKQFDRRLSIDGVIIANDGTEIAAIDDTIDIEPLPTGVAANLVGLPTLDPAVPAIGLW